MKLRFRDVKAIPNMSSEEYHSKPYNSLSASRLKCLMESERKFQLKYILKQYSDEEKAHFKFGQFLHHVVLESIKVDETNWNHKTVAMFEGRNPPADVAPTIERRDGADQLTEQIWVVSSPVPGVFRKSRDWGCMHGCHWRHTNDLVEVDEETKDEMEDPEPLLCGFVAFQDMLVDGDGFLAIPYELLGKNGSKSTKAFKDWKKKHRGERLMDATGDNSWHQAVRMRQELRMSEPSRRLLFDAPGESLFEYTLVGYDIDFGYEVRIRMDKARVENRVIHITDLKSSMNSEPNAFRKQCWDNSMPMQAWMMVQLASASFGMDVEYKYVAVGKDIDCRVEVFETDYEAIELGGEMYDEAVVRFQECDRSGIWRPKTFGHVHRIEVPYWMMKDRNLKKGVAGSGADGFYD